MPGKPRYKKKSKRGIIMADNWQHIPILAKEIADLLLQNKSGYYLDGTLGLGGHTKLFLSRLENSAKILGLDYCGVDILEGLHGEPIISEVNSNAFYEGIEKTTGINVAGCYVDYLLSKN